MNGNLHPSIPSLSSSLRLRGLAAWRVVGGHSTCTQRRQAAKSQRNEPDQAVMRPFQAFRRIVRFQAGHVRTIRAAFLAACRSFCLLVIRRRGMGIQVMVEAFEPRLAFFAQEMDRVLFDCGQSSAHKTIDDPVGRGVVCKLIDDNPFRVLLGMLDQQEQGVVVSVCQLDVVTFPGHDTPREAGRRRRNSTLPSMRAVE